MQDTEAAPETEAAQDARRALEICNACRYCEGICAVFPAMELRREFATADLNYLANLCHGCKGCYYSCQYAPPHEFGINLPKNFAELRVESYEAYAWPQALGGLFQRNGVVVSLAMALGVAIVLILAMVLQRPEVLFAARAAEPGAFYAVIPYQAMVWTAGASFGFALLALLMGGINFWRHAGPSQPVTIAAFFKAIGDVATLRNLGGGGAGCHDRSESLSGVRRRFHHAMFYGFMLCFASTSVATVYHHWFGWEAPYALLSLPVILGTLGGIGMTIGTLGLLTIRLTADQIPTAPKLLGADVAMLFLLGMAAVTGLALLALRATGAMGVALAVHLGFILALFLTLPYSRMVHGLYRGLALLHAAIERKAGH